MRSHLSLCLLFLALNFSFSPFCFGQEQATYECTYREGTNPVFDGKTDQDSFWNSIPVSSDFKIYKTDTTASPRTCFKAAYNDEALFLGIWCEEPDIQNIKTRFKDNENVSKDDGIELFIFPPGMETYWHFIVNTDGFRYNGKGYNKKALFNWSTAAYKGEDFYSIEIKIPFEVFRVVPEKNGHWRVNIARNLYKNRTFPSTRHAVWGQSDFHTYDTFNLFLFTDSVSEKTSGKIKLAIKKEIENELKKIADYKSNSSLLHKRSVYFFLVDEDCESIRQDIANLDKLSITALHSLLQQSTKITDNTRKLWLMNDEIRGNCVLKSFFEL